MNKKILILSFLSVLFLAAGPIRAAIDVTNLRTEQLKNPSGIDTRQPRLGWRIESDEQNVMQTAYHILVASSPELLAQGKGDMWDSGKVETDASQWITYQGETLKRNAPYFWKVKVYTNKGESDWSSPAFWSMGLFNEADWQGQWIGLDRAAPGDSETQWSRLAARYLRKEFALKKEIKRATVHIAGMGLYELFINGQRIGDQVLAPAPTDYRKTILYNTYDVTSQLQQENAIGVTLGNGRFYTMRQNYKPYKIPTFGYPKLRLNLIVEYADGSKETIATNTSWKLTTEGPVRSNNESHGEEYDARKELGNWTQTDYDDTKWMPAERVSIPSGTLRAQMMPGMKVTETLKPVSIQKMGDKYIMDTGQNLAGWVRFRIKGQAGDSIRLHFAERLESDGEIFTKNLRDAHCTDIYVVSGREPQGATWAPRFVYHGFRFVEVSGLDYKPELSAFTGHVIYDEMTTTGRFETSHPLVNQIHKNAYWGIRGNYRGMPTDCPQRDERLGWLGDRATGAYGEAFIFNNAQLYNKWLQDIEDSMSPEGSISDVSPNYWTIYADDVTWPSAFFYVADMLYRQFGDDSAIRAHYPAMKRWMAHMEEATMKDYIMTKDQYGDWCMPPESQELIHSKDPARKTDGAILSTTVYYDLLNKMIGFARICGQDADISGYESLAAKIKAAYNAKFFNKETAEYGNNTVTANILSLRLGLVPEGYEGKVFSNIVKKTEEDFNGHVSTGVLGIQHLMRGLTEYGRVDMAYKILTNETYPSWGYMIKNGATTIWELWNGDTADPAMNSANHVMLLGDLLIWYYEDLAGIKCAPDAVGFKKLVMEPVFPDGLDEVSASYGSVYGEIKSAWTKKGGDFSWDITLPGNTSAIVRIPKKYNVTVGNLPGVRRVSATEGYMEVEIGSGSYHFGK